MMISTWATRLSVTVAVLLWAAVFGTPAMAGEPDFLDPAQAFVGSARVGNAKTVELRIDVAPHYHLYRERISVEAEGAGATLGEVVIPAGKIEFDSNFNKNVEVLQGSLLIRVPVQPTGRDFRLRVAYQGCAD